MFQTDNNQGQTIAKISSKLMGLLSDANYSAFRQELHSAQDQASRVQICHKWHSMVRVLNAAVAKNGSSVNQPLGRAAFSFYKAIEQAQARGWTIQDSRSYTARVEFAHWGGPDETGADNAQVFRQMVHAQTVAFHSRPEWQPSAVARGVIR